MGMVFGKTGASEPAFEVLLSRTTAKVCPYELRRYGTRYAVEASYGTGESPFMILAGYIGVLSTPQNEGRKYIAMTTPVAISDQTGTKIAMTTPVVMDSTSSTKKMQFMLPAEYDSLEMVPKPTDARVCAKEIPAAVGAIHRFSGSFNDTESRKKATELAQQLREDGLDISEAEALSRYQLWAYNGPMTIPFLKRNEIWIETTENQVDDLRDKFQSS